MSDTQATYQQKLAKKVAEIVVCNPDKEFSDRIYTVLATEGVVDPEEHAKLMKDYASRYRAWHDTEQRLAALKAEVERLKEELDRAWREVLGWKEGKSAP